MDSNDRLTLSVVLIVAVVAVAVAAVIGFCFRDASVRGSETTEKARVACAEAGMQWIDDNCVAATLRP